MKSYVPVPLSVALNASLVLKVNDVPSTLHENVVPFASRIVTGRLATPVKFKERLTRAFDAVRERVSYPSSAACDRTELRSCDVGKKDSFNAMFAVNALMCVLYANTSSTFDKPEASKSYELNSV